MDPYCNKRYAYEWYVRKMDEWYWKRTKDLVNKVETKITAFAVTSAAILIVLIAICSFSRLQKFH